MKNSSLPFQVPEFYDGWTIRLYYDLEEGSAQMKDLCDLACNDSNIDLCYVRDIPSLGDVSKVFAMNWRFFPMVDPQVRRDPQFLCFS